MAAKTVSIGYSIILSGILMAFAFRTTEKETNEYKALYLSRVNDLLNQQTKLGQAINDCSGLTIPKIKEGIRKARLSLKAADFWLRYLEPVTYKKINGPLDVEWETEVFEKFEKPYKREGAGLTLAELYLGEKRGRKSVLINYVDVSVGAIEVFKADSTLSKLGSKDHFFLCNRLFILNLAAIYTTGFECPEPANVIPELLHLLTETKAIYETYNKTHPGYLLNGEYLAKYNAAMEFVKSQPMDNARFDHFTFIRDHVNPLFAVNQEHIRKYMVGSVSYMDYTLNDQCSTIFNKKLYRGQNSKGVFLRVYDEDAIRKIEELGKLLFYDPILSGNNKRSCASCHKQENCFTDTTRRTALQFDGKLRLPRNTPSLINAPYNHLIMLDGQHFSLQDQLKSVITNSAEMGGKEEETVEKVMSCREYEKGFRNLLRFTPQEKKVGMDHIASAITMYYSKFSGAYSSFDRAMNEGGKISAEEKMGFNLFMGKARCATCHFVPQFNGVKPPYISSEFEVLGTPDDTAYQSLSEDEGRFKINPAREMKNAFRTGTVRNAARTAPYMHNGVFSTLQQLIDLYDAGGGTGRGLKVENQTLPPDSLHLTNEEKKALLVFIRALNEDIVPESPPLRLPASKSKNLDSRKVGGEY